jgi:hypothetical protein
MAEAARAYIAREHDLERVAEAYAGALEEAAGGQAVTDAVLRDLAGAASDVGLDTAAVRELGVRAREAGLGD